MNFKKMYFLNPVATNITEEKKIYMKKKKKRNSQKQYKIQFENACILNNIKCHEIS